MKNATPESFGVSKNCSSILHKNEKNQLNSDLKQDFHTKMKKNQLNSDCERDFRTLIKKNQMNSALKQDLRT